MKKRFALRAILFLVVASLLSACASSGDSMSGDSASSSGTSGTPVPGEKLSDEGKFTPGGPGASGSVHW
jgi:ABC-type glycerol-3-phosphate transport system substrate-binding protein